MFRNANPFYIIMIAAGFYSCDFRYANNPFEYPTSGSTGQTVIRTINDKLSQNPNDGSLLKRKVRFLESVKWPKESRSTLKRAIKVLPEDGELQYLKAQFHLDKGELTQGILSMEEAGKLGYLTAEYFSAYAKALLQAGKVQEALKQANQFNKLDPENYRSDFLIGKILYQLGDTVAAIFAFDRAFESQSQVDELNFLLLDIYLSRNDTSGFNTVVKNIRRDEPNSLMKLGLLKFKHGKTAEAIIDIGNVLSIDQEHIAAILFLTKGHYKQEAYDSAIYYSRMAIGLDSLNKEARLYLARSLDRKFFYSQSIDSYKELIAIDSTYQNASSELNEVYRKVAYLRRLRVEKEAIPEFNFGPARKSTNSNNQHE